MIWRPLVAVTAVLLRVRQPEGRAVRAVAVHHQDRQRVAQAQVDRAMREGPVSRRLRGLVVVEVPVRLAGRVRWTVLVVLDIRGSTARSTVEAVARRMAAIPARQGVPVVVVLVLFIPVWRGLLTRAAAAVVAGLTPEVPEATVAPAL